MSIEEKFKLWFSNFTKLGLSQSEIWHIRLGFENGYELAQEEMQEKLDAVIRSKGVACLKHDLIHHIGCGHCLDEAIQIIKDLKPSCSHNDNSSPQYHARNFLKARGE